MELLWRWMPYALSVFIEMATALLMIMCCIGKYFLIKSGNEFWNIDLLLFMIVVLITVLTFNFLGTYGFIRMNRRALYMFWIFNIVWTLAIIAIAATFFLKPQIVQDVVIKIGIYGIKNTDDDESLKVLADVLQMKYQCCGINSYRDWNNSDRYKCSDGVINAASVNHDSLESCSVPTSCCKNSSTFAFCGRDALKPNVKNNLINDNGCSQLLFAVLYSNGAISLVGVCSVVVVQVFLVYCASRQINKIKKYKE